MRKTLFLFLFLFLFLKDYAQSVGIGTTTPDPKAQLDISSNSKGLLIPRLTTAQRNAISNPSFGLIVFDTDKAAVMLFDGAKWKALSFADEEKLTSQRRDPNDPSFNALLGN